MQYVKDRSVYIARFWTRVDHSAGINDCWPYTGLLDASGYGVFWAGHALQRAHRFAWEITHASIHNGFQCLHRCDNRACCNPAHLFLGTNADNVADKMAKGRHRAQPHGEGNTRAKLTSAQVLSLRSEYTKGNISQDELARRYGIGQTQVSRILRRKAWTHV